MHPTTPRCALFHWRLWLALIALIAIAPCFAASPTPFPEPTSASSLFKNRPFGPIPPPTPTPTPKHFFEDEQDEIVIPQGLWIGGIVVAALAAAALLYGAARSWRSSNLFDRQYRFPTGGKAALRFGGMRCGGNMATIKFDGEDLPPPSKTEDV